ncbi:hypothetical protein VTN77DRAFT_2833 [Rasamsonia byssochlamydoides]|uniref:uncharacterized protein n=1 Tax=Rasamsonia byssochlamydoides TaxID=89139 RepID=UPI00374240D5
MASSSSSPAPAQLAPQPNQRGPTGSVLRTVQSGYQASRGTVARQRPQWGSTWDQAGASLGPTRQTLHDFGGRRVGSCPNGANPKCLRSFIWRIHMAGGGGANFRACLRAARGWRAMIGPRSVAACMQPQGTIAIGRGESGGHLFRAPRWAGG